MLEVQPLILELRFTVFARPRSAHAGQPKRVIEFAIGVQAGIRGNSAAVDFQLQAAVEIDPQRPRFCFTHRVGHDRALNVATRY